MSAWNYKLPAAVHGVLDDANLTTEEFRVMAHVCRRCGDEENGRQCDSSIPKMAKICRLNPATVRDIIVRMVEWKWLERIERPGRTTIHVARFPDPSSFKGGVQHQDRGMVSRDPSGLKGGDLSDLKGGDPSELKGDEVNPPSEPIKGTQRVSNPRAAKDEIVMSLPFPSEEFAEAWRSWLQHRKEMRKPVTPSSAAKQLVKLKAMGEKRAIAAINHSIEKGWQGIFEPSATSLYPSTPNAPLPTPYGSAVAGTRTYTPKP